MISIALHLNSNYNDTRRMKSRSRTAQYDMIRHDTYQELYILVMQCSLVVYHGKSHQSFVFSRCQENTGAKFYGIQYIENTVTNTINVTCTRCMRGSLDVLDTVEYTAAFLCSDWLYVLWLTLAL